MQSLCILCRRSDSATCGTVIDDKEEEITSDTTKGRKEPVIEKNPFILAGQSYFKIRRLIKEEKERGRTAKDVIKGVQRLLVRIGKTIRFTLMLIRRN